MNGEAITRWKVGGQAFLHEREKSVSDGRTIKILVVHPNHLFREALAIAKGW